MISDCGSELGTFCSRLERYAHTVCRVRQQRGKWIKRVLKRRTEKHPLVVFENLLGTISLVHIEINNGNPVQAVLFQRMSRTHSNVVVNAKSQGPVTFGVMPRRPYAAEG